MFKTKQRIRKTHRYLGVAIGVQFLLWTVSGLYFSWTDLDSIHGDQYFKEAPIRPQFDRLIALDSLRIPIHQMELVAVGETPYFWINDSLLIQAQTGRIQKGITPKQAEEVARFHLRTDLRIKKVTKINQTDTHHEYRGRPLPAYVIQYDHPADVRAYVAAANGQFQRVRHRSWRWFDFLWMTHTMDYQGRDNFNNLLLRIFSLFGVFTVASGFLLWASSSPTLRKWRK